jgi:hypothetical protein
MVNDKSINRFSLISLNIFDGGEADDATNYASFKRLAIAAERVVLSCSMAAWDLATAAVETRQIERHRSDIGIVENDLR